MASTPVVPQIDRQGGLGVLARLPREVLIEIMRYIAPYEPMGLCRVSKAFRALIHVDYDRFTEHTWQMGKVVLQVSPRRVDDLNLLAQRAFSNIVGKIPACIKKGPNDGVLCDTIVRLSSSHKTPTGHDVIEMNCLGELIADGVRFRALNFIGYSDQVATNQLLTALEVDPRAFNDRKVTNHHVELRFIWKLATGLTPQTVQLKIDKLCSLFCAIQLLALGHRSLIPGWHARALSWYTFSPLVIFFRDRRSFVWGQQVEDAFSGLTPAERLYVLGRIVDLTQNTGATSQLIRANATTPTPPPASTSVMDLLPGARVKRKESTPDNPTPGSSRSSSPLAGEALKHPRPSPLGPGSFVYPQPLPRPLSMPTPTPLYGGSSSASASSGYPRLSGPGPAPKAIPLGGSGNAPSSAAPLCPTCGARMELRTGYGFWGCSQYGVTGCRGRIPFYR
jgi:hypothetical protein